MEEWSTVMGGLREIVGERERLTTVDSMKSLHQCERHPVGKELPYLVKKRDYSTHTIDYEMGRSTVD